MKKIFTFVAILLMVSTAAFAGPFGLEMGMSLDEVKAACDGKRPVLVDDNAYMIQPAKSHPLFEQYIVRIVPEKGLSAIIAIGYEQTVCKYGTELKDSFYDMIDRLAKTYGEPEIFDETKPGLNKIWASEEYWMYTLHNGSRRLEAVWTHNNKNGLSDKNISDISLKAITDDIIYKTGQLVLIYLFVNNNEVNNAADSVF